MINNEESHKILHGKNLETIITDLEKTIGWEKMAEKIPIRCFQFEPSIKSSLAFLRKNEWARKKVEVLYVFNYKKIERYSLSNK